MIFSAISAVGMAGIALSTVRLKQTNVLLVQFHYGWSSCLMTLPILLCEAIINKRMPFTNHFTWTTVGCLIAASIFNSFSQNVMTISNQRGNPIVVAFVVYLQMFYNWLADVFVFGVHFEPE